MLHLDRLGRHAAALALQRTHELVTLRGRGAQQHRRQLLEHCRERHAFLGRRRCDRAVQARQRLVHLRKCGRGQAAEAHHQKDRSLGLAISAPPHSRVQVVRVGAQQPTMHRLLRVRDAAIAPGSAPSGGRIDGGLGGGVHGLGRGGSLLECLMSLREKCGHELLQRRRGHTLTPYRRLAIQPARHRRELAFQVMPEPAHGAAHLLEWPLLGPKSDQAAE